MERNYDGYHFHPDGDGVFNPFSVLNAFSKLELGNYWFQTGTPTFLIELLQKVTMICVLCLMASKLLFLLLQNIG